MRHLKIHRRGNVRDLTDGVVHFALNGRRQRDFLPDMLAIEKGDWPKSILSNF